MFVFLAQDWEGRYLLSGATTINAQVSLYGADVTFLENVTLNDSLYIGDNSSVACTPTLSLYSYHATAMI